MVTMGNENVPPSNIPRASSRPDPMAMLLEAKREHTEVQDKKLASKVAEGLALELARDVEQHKAAMLAQSEEDEAALRAAELEAEDRRLAQQTQMHEEQAALQEQNQLKAQLTEDQKIALALQQELAKKLYNAIHKTDAMAVDMLLRQGMDPSIILASSDSKLSALQHAVLKRHLEIIRLLVGSKGIDLDYQNAHGNTAMHFAAETNRCDIMTILLIEGAKPDIKNKLRTSPLMFAARNGYYDPIELLIKHGADLYYKDTHNKMALHLVPMLSRSLKHKLEGMMGWGLLENAKKGRGDDVMSLIGRGASVFLSDDKNQTALHYAASAGRNLVVQYLLDKKANPNKRDVKGETPLHKAAQVGSGAVWTTLLKGGANPQIKDKKGLIAEQHCNKNVPLSQMLLSSRKRPSSAKSNRTPLSLLASKQPSNNAQAPPPAQKPRQESAETPPSEGLETNVSDAPAHVEAEAEPAPKGLETNVSDAPAHVEAEAEPAPSAADTSSQAPSSECVEHTESEEEEMAELVMEEDAPPGDDEAEAAEGARAAEPVEQCVPVPEESDSEDDDEMDMEGWGSEAEPTVISTRPCGQLSEDALARSESGGSKKPHRLPPLKTGDGELLPTTSFSTRSSAATTPLSALSDGSTKEQL